MLILGIDPGTINLGYAFLTCDNNLPGLGITYLKSGTLTFSKDVPFIERLFLIQESFSKTIDGYSPDEVAFEAPIFVKNPTILSKLAQVRGSLMSTLGLTYRKKIFEYSPNFVKQTTTGFGHADKLSVQKFLQFQFVKQSISFQSFDESDAILVALCHIFSTKNILAYNSLKVKNVISTKKKSNSKPGSKSLAQSLSHLINNE